MISITAQHVDAMAPNAGASANGRKLVAKGQYANLSVTPDGALVFGSCAGSGKSAYACSVDFADPAKPVPRCSCPSRQIPCKHCLGLLYAWVAGASRFAQAEPLPELLAKRETAAKRAATRQANAGKPAAPRKTNVAALKKKLGAQLEALALLDTILADLLNRGLGAHGRKEAAALAANAKLLRGAYLPGAELALLRLSDIAERASTVRQAGRDESALQHRAMDELARLEALMRRGKAYLEARIEDPKLAPETDSAIAAWLGHAWQYEELQSAGCGEGAAELVQLAFFVVDDRVKAERIDTGLWLHLGDGRLLRTETLRPYKALGHVKADDSVFDAVRVPEFVRYPGQTPPRVRWQGQEHRAPLDADRGRVRVAAETDFAATIKGVKADLKAPLGAPCIVRLLMPARIGVVHDGDATTYAIEDAAGVRIELADPVDGAPPGPPPTARLLPLVGDQAEGAAVLCLFHHDPATLRLRAQPLSFVHDTSIIRLAF